MRTLNDLQWECYFDAVAQLQAMPRNERRVALPRLCREAADRDIAALLELHLAMRPEVERCRSGERIRNLLLHEPIGSGGMGTVYRATQTFCDGVEREVAVKLIHPAQLRENASDAQRRFRAEIGALVRLEHEGIARIYDGGVDRCPERGDETYYLAMELVRGQPLTDYVAARRAQLRTEGILRLFLRVCSAVAHAHRHGIVHCDLKPAHILVDEHASPRLIDFGLASHCAGIAWGGTPAYASPEQLAGEPATPAMDVYALGVILHELLAGRYPHASGCGGQGGSARALHNRALACTVAKACASDAARRYPTTAEFFRALSCCLNLKSARARQRPGGCPRTTAFAGGSATGRIAQRA
jgi:eukaryotic-like serine/threonine-protein kinase